MRSPIIDFGGHVETRDQHTELEARLPRNLDRPGHRPVQANELDGGVH